MLVGYDSQSAGHGFRHHVAPGLRQRREQKQVGAGVMPCQLFGGDKAGEVRFRQGFLQGATGRTVADNDLDHVGASAAHGAKGVTQEGEVFLCCQATYVQYHWTMLIDSPATAQLGTAQARSEARVLDTPPHDLKTMKALVGECLCLLPGGYQGQLAAIVKPA